MNIFLSPFGNVFYLYSFITSAFKTQEILLTY
jgi:hypothetical protein